MRFLLVEPFSGASGDMFLGALLDLGVPRRGSRDGAADAADRRLVALRRSETTRGGIAATKARVRLDALGRRRGGLRDRARAPPRSRSRSDHGHDHRRTTTSTAHASRSPHGHGTAHHVQRTPGEIFAIIRASGLPDGVKARACDVFAALAAGRGPRPRPDAGDGALPRGRAPSTRSSTSAARCSRCRCSASTACFATTATTGFGLVRCAHGTVPSPAPATVFLMEGLPVRPRPGRGRAADADRRGAAPDARHGLDGCPEAYVRASRPGSAPEAPTGKGFRTSCG